MKILGLVPARSGSKRVPHKNVKPLEGRPLIEWTLRTAFDSGAFYRIVVSTDDPATARLAKDLGVEVPALRRAVLATDQADVLDAVIEMLGLLAVGEVAMPDAVMLLQPTSPFRSVQTIKRAVELLTETPTESVVSVSPALSHPYWCRQVDGAGRLRPFMPEAPEFARSQDLPPAYVLNGLVYLTPTRHLQTNKSFYTPNTRALIVDSAEERIDIDTPLDWQLAELVAAKHLHHRDSR